MKKQIQAMLFDFDGTLVDTGDDLATSVNFTLAQLRLAPLDKNTIISYVGDGVRELLLRSIDSSSSDRVDTALAIFSAYYEEHLLDQSRLYPHVETVLTHFSLVPKVIVTNKQYQYTKAIAEGLNIDRHFKEMIGADSTPWKKPDGRVILDVMRRHMMDPEKTVMIGDGPNDILAARNAHIASCVFLKGLGRADQLQAMGADYYIEDWMELKDLFEGIC